MIETPKRRLSSFSKKKSEDNINSTKIQYNKETSFEGPLSHMLISEKKKTVQEKIKEDEKIILLNIEREEKENENLNTVHTIIYEPDEKGIGENLITDFNLDNNNDNNGFLNWFCCKKNNEYNEDENINFNYNIYNNNINHNINNMNNNNDKDNKLISCLMF